jgi:hypothetical protein
MPRLSSKNSTPNPAAAEQPEKWQKHTPGLFFLQNQPGCIYTLRILNEREAVFFV